MNITLGYMYNRELMVAFTRLYRVMRKKEYLDTMKRINKQIAKYLENGFNELNPRQHLFELIGWRNLLTRKPDEIKEFKKSGDEYKLAYVGNLKEFLSTKTYIKTDE